MILAVVSLADEHEQNTERATISMHMDEYQAQTLQTAVYPNIGNNLDYPVHGLSSEAGELAPYALASMDAGDEDMLQDVQGELGDVLWYSSIILYEMGMTFSACGMERSEQVARDAREVVGYRSFVQVYLCLMEEVGHISGHVKKRMRDDEGNLTEARKQQIVETLRQVVTLIARMGSLLNLPFDTLLQANIAKLRSRQQRGVIGGTGDKR
jgi:NTP pyrophosphatase (non-canonical NTP hydrolase)